MSSVEVIVSLTFYLYSFVFFLSLPPDLKDLVDLSEYPLEDSSHLLHAT